MRKIAHAMRIACAEYARSCHRHTIGVIRVVRGADSIEWKEQPLEVASGVITIASLGLCLYLGLRLLNRSGWLNHEGREAEFWLGIFFVFFQAISSAMTCAVYAGWSDPDLILSDRMGRTINGLYYIPCMIGVFGLVHFTRITFRPKAGWAKSLVVLLYGSMLVGVIGLGVSEGFELRVVNGPFYWVIYIARNAILGWMCLESLRCYRMSRRRLRLGLSSPIISNRFLLWTIWAALQIGLGAADPIARVVYFMSTGSTTEWIPALGRPIILVMISTSTLGLVVSSTALLLTFMPTAAYRRWIERHSTAKSSV